VDLNSQAADKWVAYMAASDLKSKEGEVNQLIEKKLPQLEAAVMQQGSPTIRAIPEFANNDPYEDARWYKTSMTTIKVYL
jgi:hypothetical protein